MSAYLQRFFRCKYLFKYLYHIKFRNQSFRTNFCAYTVLRIFYSIVVVCHSLLCREGHGIFYLLTSHILLADVIIIHRLPLHRAYATLIYLVHEGDNIATCGIALTEELCHDRTGCACKSLLVACVQALEETVEYAIYQQLVFWLYGSSVKILDCIVASSRCSPSGWLSI